MSDETTAPGPSDALLKAKHLVAVTEINGEPLRSFDAVHQDFPTTTVYTTPAPVTPPPVITPPPVVVPPVVTPPTAGPSGIPITPVAPGYKRALEDDMLGTALNPANWTDGGNGVLYDGESGGTATGYFSSAHVAVANSVANFLAYPDAENIAKCYEYNAALAASLNDWCGAGTHSKISVGPGSVSRVCMKYTPYPGVAPMAIFFGATTEFDFAETNDITAKGQAITKIYGSVHWNNHSQQSPFTITAPAGVDFSQWGVFEADFTSTALIVRHSTDGENYVECGSYVFTTAEIAAGILAVQPLCLQIQTGDVMPNPGPDASVTPLNPVAMPVDWVTIDVAV